LKKNDQKKRTFFATIADQFDNLQNEFDLKVRKEIIFQKFLNKIELKNKRILEVGCGSGGFVEEILKLQSIYIGIDIAWQLIKIAGHKKGARLFPADVMDLPFPSQYFDLVISSEVVEHTEEPHEAITSMARVVKKNGFIVLTCPNKKWQWLVRLASVLNIRKFYGYENFIGFNEMRVLMNDLGFRIIEHIGFNPWPYQIKFMQNMSRAADRKYGHRMWGRYMINQAVFAEKISNQFFNV